MAWRVQSNSSAAILTISVGCSFTLASMKLRTVSPRPRIFDTTSVSQLWGYCQPANTFCQPSHRLTLPLSGRLRDLAISADSTVACPIEGLVRRCRFFKGKHGRPLPRQQRSSHLRFTSHTCAQLQSKSRDDLQDGVKAGVGCCQALAGVLAPGIIERSTRHEALVRYKSSGRSEYRTENLAAYLFSAEVLICCPAVVNGDVSLVEVE